MSYSFEYIDIILLAMIAGFIFLRLRGILGKRSGFEGKAPAKFDKILNEVTAKQSKKNIEVFDESAQKEFLKGANIAYETIITDFSDNDNKQKKKNKKKKYAQKYDYIDGDFEDKDDDHNTKL